MEQIEIIQCPKCYTEQEYTYPEEGTFYISKYCKCQKEYHRLRNARMTNGKKHFDWALEEVGKLFKDYKK